MSLRKILKTTVMILGGILLTTVIIDATDNINNFSGSLLGSAIGITPKEKSLCPEGMSYVQHPEKSFCIDTYTASAGEDCPYPDPKTQEETRINILSSECKAVSQKDRVPWRHISQTQAREVCRVSGKYLISAKEWYTSAQGTPSIDSSEASLEDCNINQNWLGDAPGRTGSGIKCVSGVGAYDMVGNVWEWVDDEVIDGDFEGAKLPKGGYITSVNKRGVPLVTDLKNPDPGHGGDELWLKEEGTVGVMRGGFHGSGNSAGIYSFHAQMEPSFFGRAVGFRCGNEVLK